MQINEELLDIEGIKNSKVNMLELFIRRTAVLTSTYEDLVEKIIKDQWSAASKVSQPGVPISEIDFPNLGLLYVSKPKARKRLRKVEASISNNIHKEHDESNPEAKEWLKTWREKAKHIKIKAKIEVPNED